MSAGLEFIKNHGITPKLLSTKYRGMWIEVIKFGPQKDWIPRIGGTSLFEFQYKKQSRGGLESGSSSLS